MPQVSPLRIASLYVALLASGGAALIYQTTWGRMLQRVFGVSDLAIATVLATFFLGLGLGSAAGARFAKAPEGSKRSAARVYALLEIGVGLWALASLWLMPRIHDVYSWLGADLGFGTLTVLRFTLAVFVLLPPTFLMGATLPVLIAAVARGGVNWDRSATFLYATNTLGAVVGAAATGLWLVPTYGARTSVIIAASLSFAAAVIVLAMWSRASSGTDTAPTESPDLGEALAEPMPMAAPGNLRLAMGLAAAAGFASLAGEVLWTRALRLVVQGTTQAFAAMLTVFLTGIALGSLIAAPLARRFDARVLFGVLQLLLGVLTLTSMLVAARLPQVVMLIQAETVVVPHDAWVVLVAAAILLLPLTLVLGTSIPIAWRIAGGSQEEAAKNSGRVLAANTLGGLLGSLIAGFLLVPHLGLQRSLGFVAFIHFVTATGTFVARALERPVVRLRDFLAVLPIALGAIALIHPPSLYLPYLLDAWYDPSRALIEGPRDDWAENVRLIEEGRNTTVTVLERDETLRLFNDGRPESGIGTAEPGFGAELATLGSLPTLHAARRERAMAIGLGAGHSAAVLLGGPWERIDVVELESAIVDAARFLYASRDKPFPLDDGRARLVVDDARAQLVLTPPDTYDAIVSQPSHPWLAGSSALYTTEFFQEAKTALRSGGVLALWSNLFRMDSIRLRQIVATLLRVFEHVHAYMCEDSSFILAASDQPLEYGDEFAARVASEGLRPFLRPFQLDDVSDFGSILEFDTAGARAFAAGAEPLVDDRPALEFALARIPQARGLLETDVDWMLHGVPWITPLTMATFHESQRVEVLMRRLDFVGDRWHASERVRIALEGLPITETERQLVRGAIAEQRGDVAGAIAAYTDAMDDLVAKDRLADLLDAERLYEQQIRLQLGGARVDSPMYLMRAAVALNRREAARSAVEEEARRNTSSDDDFAEVVRAWLGNDCPRLMALDETRPLAFHEEGAARLARACAAASADPTLLEKFGEQLARNLRRISTEEFRMGSEAEDGGNGSRAARHYIRALKVHPGHAQAAVNLARIQYRLVGEAAAADVLRAARTHAVGLPAAENAIRDAAGELALDLDAQPEELEQEAP